MEPKKLVNWPELDPEEFEEAWNEPLTPEEAEEIRLADAYYNTLFKTADHSFLSSQTWKTRECFEDFMVALKDLSLFGPDFGTEKRARTLFDDLVEELRKIQDLPPRE